ncbi:MAG: MltA domain-containing protein [Pseudomonadota bacterium]
MAATSFPAPSVASPGQSGWHALNGWSDEAFRAAAVAFGGLPGFAAGSRTALEAAFVPEPLAAPIHLTAYYEPEIPARRRPGGGFDTPVLTMPEGWEGSLPTRAAIEGGALGAFARPIAWLDDPIALFFLQVQGSGRLRLEDEGGRVLRVGYAGRNGHPYVSIGAILRREAGLETLDAEGLRSWLSADRERGAALMARNPSYVFFRVREDLAPADGPVGAWGRPLPAGHAIAVDPAHHAYGGLFWIERGDGGASALWMAMDTGAAIRGAGRFDLFLGSGHAARLAASAVNGGGRVFRLHPRQARHAAPAASGSAGAGQ